jgi:hypothetical protein
MAAKVINIMAVFTDKDLEGDYSRWSLPGNRPAVYFGVALLSLVWLCFIPTDYRLSGLSSVFFLLLALRAWQIALGVAVALVIKKSDNEKLYRYLVCIFWLSTLAAILIVNTTRPARFSLHFFVDIMALLLSYIMMPNWLIYQVGPALIFTLLSLGHFIYFKHIEDPNELQLVFTTYIMVNIIGVILSWRMSVERRKRYLVLAGLQQANQGLEKALAEIKTLKGIVPICAKCKKIRDDKGYWNQLEEYMRTHLDAEFSHGLCPDCMRELYPEVAEKILERHGDNKGPQELPPH